MSLNKHRKETELQMLFKMCSSCEQEVLEIIVKEEMGTLKQTGQIILRKNLVVGKGKHKTEWDLCQNTYAKASP